MTLMDVATKLVAGCREGRETENLDTLYAPDAVSAEAFAMPGTDMPREITGVEAIKQKHAWWDSAVEMIEAHVGDPMVHGEDQFAVIFKMKARDKASGEMMDMEEVGLYTVAGGKIIREQFFYAPPPAG